MTQPLEQFVISYYTYIDFQDFFFHSVSELWSFFTRFLWFTTFLLIKPNIHEGFILRVLVIEESPKTAKDSLSSFQTHPTAMINQKKID